MEQVWVAVAYHVAIHPVVVLGPPLTVPAHLGDVHGAVTALVLTCEHEDDLLPKHDRDLALVFHDVLTIARAKPNRQLARFGLNQHLINDIGHVEGATADHDIGGIEVLDDSVAELLDLPSVARVDQDLKTLRTELFFEVCQGA